VHSVQSEKCLIDRKCNAQTVGEGGSTIRRYETVNASKIWVCSGINTSALNVSIQSILILKLSSAKIALKTRFSGFNPDSVNIVLIKSPILTDNTVTPVPMISIGTTPRNRVKIADKTKYFPNNFHPAFAPLTNIKTSSGFALPVNYLATLIMTL
jgi:hypothetical protein